MKYFKFLLFASVLFLGSSLAGLAQMTGSAALSIDPASGMIAATCETDLNASAQAFCHAVVNCKVTDTDGKVIASGEYVDENGIQGYALVALTFVGVPGTTYTVDASHELDVVLQTRAASPFEIRNNAVDFDPFNFGDLEKLHLTYEGMYEWFGSGIGVKK